MKKNNYILFIVLFIILLVLYKNNISFKTKKEAKNNDKTTLKLMHDDTKDLTYQETEAIVEEKKVGKIKFKLGKETEYHFFDKEKDYDNLKVILDYIKSNFNIDINNKWKYQINVISSDYGLIKFVYYLNDEIETNKAITFEINNDIVDMVYYSYLNENIDEKDTISKVEKFKENTVQEKEKLKSTEKLIEEKISYSYNYRLGKVIYTYCLFFQKENGTINNSIGSSYFIE